MEWATRVRAAFDGRQMPDEDVLDELTQHAASAYQAARAEGHGDEEAVRAVEAQLAEWANDDQLLQRRPRRAPVVEPPPSTGSRLAGLGHDLRFAAHLLSRNWGHSLIVTLTMALGIGASTVLFSVAYGVLLKPLPWPGADRLVRVAETRQGSSRPVTFFTNSTYLAWNERPTTIESIGAYSSNTAMVTGAGETVRVLVVYASPSLFEMLAVRPTLGSPFAVSATGWADRTQVLISHGLWLRRFGGSRSVIGRMLRLDNEPVRIVGVMPPSFGFPSPRVDAWLPLNVKPAVTPGRKGGALQMFSAVAKLRAGVTVAQVQTEATARGRSAPDPGLVVMAVFGSRGPVQVTVTPLMESMVGRVRPALLVFLAAVGLLLVTATANVASLQLARATNRRREMAIRCALGAGSARLVRQLLVENVLLGVAGGLAGLGIALGLVRVLPALLPANFPRVQDIAVDWRAAVFAIAASVAAGIAFGVVPSLQTRRLDVSGALADDGRSPTGIGRRTSTSRARLLIMMGQVAVASVLLVGAMQLTRSVIALLTADRGFDAADVITAQLPFPEGLHTPPGRAALLDQTVARLKQLPGVTHAAYTSRLPLGQVVAGSAPAGGLDEIVGAFFVPARNGGGMVEAQADIRQVSAEYFAALGVQVVEGRGFNVGDTSNSRPVVVVNRAFARKYFDRAVGSELAGSPVNREVVGVVDDVKNGDVADAAQPELYQCAHQLTGGYQGSSPFVVVRTTGDPALVIRALRTIVREQDPSVPVESVMTMEDRVWTSLAQPRMYAALLGIFAAFALAVAAVGLFGVLSCSVLRRTREIGIRTTLGATPWGIARMVLAQAVMVTGVGLTLGIAASAALGRYMVHLLYGVERYDGVSYIVGPLALAAVAVLACVGPARRAAGVEPTKALR